MEKFNYSIGLDIGTNSVGWACINEQFEILKHRDRYAIGVHEFDAGETAEARRLQRGARRRYNRRKRRIQLLQELWTPLMDNPQPFFSYTEEPTYWRKDNQFEERSLTHVLNQMRVNPKKYPTIYHLRSALLTEDRKFDLKLIYLAIHNVVKHRGHFLNGTDEWLEGRGASNETDGFNSLIKDYQKLVNDTHVVEFDVIGTIVDICNDKDRSKTERHQAIMALLPSTLSEIIKLMLNLTGSFLKLFPLSSQVDEYKELKGNDGKLQISMEDFLVRLDLLLEEEREVMLDAQILFQRLQLKGLLGKHATVAEAKVDTYRQFQIDLKHLKEIVRNYGTEEEYRKLFITSKHNWREYKKKPNINLLCVLDRYTLQANPNQKMEDMLGNSAEKADSKNTDLYFNLFVRDLITSYLSMAKSPHQLNQLELIIRKIDEHQYMVKQVNKDNSAIPVQNSMYETRKILEKQAKYYPIMTDGWIEQVIQLIQFKIPYFVGPLVKGTTKHNTSSFGWATRHDEQSRVTPWNFHEVIDQSQTAEGFIARMTNKCTYLHTEDVLPKHALLYQQFELLDELNRIQIRRPSEDKHIDHRLDPRLKQWLMQEVFQKKQKVNHDDVMQAILRSPWKNSYVHHEDGERYQIFGTSKEKEFASSQSSYLKLKQIFGEVLESANDLYEDIIYTLTVFNEEQIIRQRLIHLKDTNVNGYLLHDDIIRALLYWKPTGWGKLSKKLLTGIPVYEHATMTLIEGMSQQHYVFNELKSPKHSIASGQSKTKQYSYLQKRIDMENTKNKNKKTTHRLTYADVEELAGSPAIKRGIWKSLKIIEELVGVFGEPQHIMLEVARDEEKRKLRTQSREDQWRLLGQSLKSSEYASFYKENSKPNDSSKFMQTRFWLYLLQGGKCLYTQTPLDINQLSTYQIDHIIPRRIVKDDGIDNLALVLSSANQRKEGTFVPLETIPHNQHYAVTTYWKSLLNLNLISRKKYDNLTKKKLTDIELDGFIKRQLVETRQIIKHVQELLQERFEDSNIHLVKANIISKFRHANYLPKVREINNKHHAVDAFLVATFILSVITKYGVNYLQFSLQRKNLDQLLTQKISAQEDFFLFRNFHEQRYPILIQQGGHQSAKEYLDEVMYDLPWQSTYAIGSAESSFYNETVYSPKMKKNYDQVKDTMSYTELTHENFNNLFSLVLAVDEIKKNKKSRKQIIMDVRVYDYYQLRGLTDQELSEKLVVKHYPQYTNVTLISKLHKYQKIQYNGEPAYFISSTELRNRKQLQLQKDVHQNVSQVLDPKFMRRKGDSSDQEQVDSKLVFDVLGDCIFKEYQHLPGVDKTKFEKASNKIDSHESGAKMIKEALKVSSASAARSDALGGRWMLGSIKPELITIIHESVTGLKYRK
ncbi:type II CRISPR RNA-guided endonuclease Cas9 [Paenibacillus sp. CMAA1364]